MACCLVNLSTTSRSSLLSVQDQEPEWRDSSVYEADPDGASKQKAHKQSRRRPEFTKPKRALRSQDAHTPRMSRSDFPLAALQHYPPPGFGSTSPSLHVGHAFNPLATMEAARAQQLTGLSGFPAPPPQQPYFPFYPPLPLGGSPFQHPSHNATITVPHLPHQHPAILGARQQPVGLLKGKVPPSLAQTYPPPAGAAPPLEDLHGMHQALFDQLGEAPCSMEGFRRDRSLPRMYPPAAGMPGSGRSTARARHSAATAAVLPRSLRGRHLHKGRLARRLGTSSTVACRYASNPLYEPAALDSSACNHTARDKAKQHTRALDPPCSGHTDVRSRKASSSLKHPQRLRSAPADFHRAGRRLTRGGPGLFMEGAQHAPISKGLQLIPQQPPQQQLGLEPDEWVQGCRSKGSKEREMKNSSALWILAGGKRGIKDQHLAHQRTSGAKDDRSQRIRRKT